MAESVLFHGGRVYTGRRYVEAILIEDGRVAAAGSRAELSSRCPVGAERVDLEGDLAVPGLVDAHVHLGELTRAGHGPDLRGARDAATLRARLQAWATEHPDGAVVARGFDLSTLSPSTWPTVADLDRAVLTRPVVVYDRSGHVALLNSAALERSGADQLASVPESSGVVRADDGRATGVMLEGAARRFGSAAVDAEPLAPEQLRQTLSDLVRMGLTTLGAMSVGTTELNALRAVLASDASLPSVRVYLRAADRPVSPSIAEPPSTDRCAVVGLKSFLDGAFGPRTASLSAPYHDESGARGVDAAAESDIASLLADAHRAGLSVALHAIGDRAVERAARWLSDGPSFPPGRPARIEHASLAPPSVIGPLLASRAVLVVQPGFLRTDLWLRDRLGPERVRWAYPFRTLLARGLTLAGSSDAPYAPADPWVGIRAAVERTDEEGRSANPEPCERLSPEQAFALYTTGGAAALGEASAGTLEPGARGDVVRLVGPTLAAAAAAERPVRASWVAGLRADGPAGATV